MAQSVGAALRDMDQIQLLQTTQPGTGNCVYAYVAPKEAAGYLFFNKEGHRFIGEDGRRDDISLAALAQTDALFYMLESSDVITDPDNQYDLLGVPMSECINAGAIIVGDTLPVFEYVSLEGTDSTFYYCFQLTDIFGETELSEMIEFYL